MYRIHSTAFNSLSFKSLKMGTLPSSSDVDTACSVRENMFDQNPLIQR
jgi:hypothetical protein